MSDSFDSNKGLHQGSQQSVSGSLPTGFAYEQIQPQIQQQETYDTSSFYEASENSGKDKIALLYEGIEKRLKVAKSQKDQIKSFFQEFSRWLCSLDNERFFKIRFPIAGPHAVPPAPYSVVEFRIGANQTTWVKYAVGNTEIESCAIGIAPDWVFSYFSLEEALKQIDEQLAASNGCYCSFWEKNSFSQLRSKTSNTSE